MTDRLSDADLDRADELAAKATPGPWVCHVGAYRSEIADYTGAYIPGVADEFVTEHDGDSPPLNVEDAEFIAFGRDALPRLVAEVREHRERESGALVQYGHRFRGEPINPFKVGTSRAFVEGHAIAESTVGPEGEVPEVLRRRVFYGPWELVTEGDDDDQ